MHALHIPLDRFRALRHGAVRPCADLHVLAALHVAGKAGRNLDGQREFPAAHALIEIGIVDDGRLLDEVARARQVQRVVAAELGLIAIEHGERETLDIHVDAVTDDEHHQDAPEQRQCGTDRVAAQLETFAQRVAQRATQAETFSACSRRSVGFAVHRRRRGGGGFGVILRCILEVGDECIFQGRRAALLDELRRRIGHQHLAGVHERDPIAALALVHEMRRDEDRDLILARQLDQQSPEGVPRDRIDTGGGLIEDQELRAVHQRYGERKTLTHAERQTFRETVGHIAQAEPLDHRGGARRDLCLGDLKQSRVQHQVLLDGELVVQRERLGHVADAPPYRDIACIDRAAEQSRLTLGGREQAGEHLHRRGLAAAVRAQKAEDLAARDAEAHVIDCDEIAEALGERTSFDGDIGMAVDRKRYVLDRSMTPTPFFREQRKEGGLERCCLGAFVQFLHGAGGQDAACIHRDEPVESAGFFHVSRGYEHAHAVAIRTDAIDEVPELPAREWIDARGGLIEDQQLRIVDQCATQSELLFHAAGELTGGA